MKFSAKDQTLLTAIEVALHERREINFLNQQDTTYFQLEEKDINPTVRLTKEFVRASTAREKIRGPVMAAYAAYFEKCGRYTVVRHGDEIFIRTKTFYDPSCSYESLRDLEMANERDREADISSQR